MPDISPPFPNPKKLPLKLSTTPSQSATYNTVSPVKIHSTIPILKTPSAAHLLFECHFPHLHTWHFVLTLLQSSQITKAPHYHCAVARGTHLSSITVGLSGTKFDGDCVARKSNSCLQNHCSSPNKILIEMIKERKFSWVQFKSGMLPLRKTRRQISILRRQCNFEQPPENNITILNTRHDGGNRRIVYADG